MPHRSSLPLQQGMLHRPRIDSMIQEGLRRPTLVMLAGPGYGKTQAMAGYLAKSSMRILWLRLTSLDNLHTHFWRRLVGALRHEFPDIYNHLQKLEFPDTPLAFDAFLHILEKSMTGPKQVVWVFDDYGEIDSQEVKAFFQNLADIDLNHFCLVLLSNALTSMESVAFMTSKRFLILGKDLQFTQQEITELYRMHAVPLETDELIEIERYTEGWPLPLHLLVLQHGRVQDLIQRDGRLSSNMIGYMFEEKFFSVYPRPLKKLLVQLSLPSSFTEELAARLYEGTRDELDGLGSHPFMTYEPSMGCFFFHHLYRLFLQKKKDMLSAQEEQAVWRKAAEYYASSGNTMEAISCFSMCGDHARMISAMCDFIRLQHGISSHGLTAESAGLLLKHIDLLTPDEMEKYPVASYLRALIHLNTLELEKAEALLLELEMRLTQSGGPEALALLGDTYAMLGALHMMRSQEDFGDYYRKAVECLPNGTVLQNANGLFTQNNHTFSISDNLPGAKERMERAVHDGVAWASRFLGGSMSGLEHIFSAEAAYLSYQLDDARQHAYRAAYTAEANAQHDLVCNAYIILARVGLMLGDLAETTRQIQSIAEYAEEHPVGVLREIRDTALGWYYIKLHDYRQIPKSILSTRRTAIPALAHGRSLLVHANYLLNTGEYARLIGMLESPQGLYLNHGIWPDRICLYIMLAIGYYQQKKPEPAINALWTAYDMAYHNGLITLFIEGERHMRPLIDLARQQNTYAFDPQWLDLIDEQAGSFAQRAAAFRETYASQNPQKPSADNPLTKREMEVLQALSRGLTREEIAAEQFVSINTVKTFIRSIFSKLGAANRAEAVSIAISRGYMNIPAL